METGELRNQLALDLQRALEKVINRYKKESSFYVLVYADLLGDRVVTKLVKLSCLPPMMLGTMCYHVNNELGELRRIWCLPFDIPREDEHVSLEEGLKEIAESAKYMPIVY